MLAAFLKLSWAFASRISNGQFFPVTRSRFVLLITSLLGSLNREIGLTPKGCPV